VDLDVVDGLGDPPVSVVGSDLPTGVDVRYIPGMFLDCAVVYYVHGGSDHYGAGVGMEIPGYANDGGGDEVHGDYDVLFDCGCVVPGGAVVHNDVVQSDYVVHENIVQSDYVVHDGVFQSDYVVHGDNVVHDAAVQSDDVVHGDDVVHDGAFQSDDAVRGDNVVHDGAVQSEHVGHGHNVVHDGTVQSDHVVHCDEIVQGGCVGMTDDVATFADSFAENDVIVTGLFQLKIQHFAQCPDNHVYVSAIQIVFCHFQMLYVVVLIHDNSIQLCVKNDDYI
jgi:hypothetical protein